MRLEIIDDDYYKVFINDSLRDKVNIDNKEQLGKYVKDVILKLRRFYNVILHGLYEVHVYVIKFIGIILEIKNMDSYLSKTIDLKIVVHNDEEVFLKIFRYELLDGYSSFKYFNNCFYLDVNDIKERDLYRLVENYNIIYGEDLLDLKNKWVSLT